MGPWTRRRFAGWGGEPCALRRPPSIPCTT
jgi:hypothetical protein